MDIPTKQICDDIIELMDHVKHKILNIAEYEGLTRMQIFGLYILDRYPDIGMTHMAEALHCDASNVTGIVDRLAQHGLVQRKEDTNDRRVKKIIVTKKGRSTVDKIMSNLPEALGCNRLTNQEKTVLHTAIKKLLLN